MTPRLSNALRQPGSPATTTSSASVATLQGLGVKRVAVAAPYEAEVCERLRKFLEESGFEVVALNNLGVGGMDIGCVPLDGMCALVKQADTPEAEGLFISCTAFRTIDMFDELEQELGKPVVSANQVTMWHALRVAGIPVRLEGLGCLYRL